MASKCKLRRGRLRDDPAVATIKMVVIVVMGWALVGWLSMLWFGE
ncbi:hypothetical protein ES705_40619 [subsurface metagenome]